LGAQYLWQNQLLAAMWDRGNFIEARRRHLSGVRLRVDPDDPELWRLDVPHDRGRATIRGGRALRVLGTFLVQMNTIGGSAGQVESAVKKLEWFGGSAGMLRFAARERDARPVMELGYAQRLALEMAAHEEQELRALEGELAALETAWQEAEELASLSDGLLLTSDVTARLDRLRDGATSDTAKGGDTSTGE
jgi:hypothetical protein